LLYESTGSITPNFVKKHRKLLWRVNMDIDKVTLSAELLRLDNVKKDASIIFIF
jgi:hypothetical protein